MALFTLWIIYFWYFWYFYLCVVIFIDHYTLSVFIFIPPHVNLLTRGPRIHPGSSSGTRTPFANVSGSLQAGLLHAPRPRTAAGPLWGSARAPSCFSLAPCTPPHRVNQEVHDGLVLPVAPSNCSERLTKPAPTETTGWAPEGGSEILSMKMQSTTS